MLHKTAVQAVFARFLTLTLMLDISVTQPAFALRQLNAGMEESPVHQQLRERFSPGPIRASMTGLEEDEPLSNWQKIFAAVAQDPTQARLRTARRFWVLRQLLTELNATRFFKVNTLTTLSVRLDDFFANRGTVFFWDGRYLLTRTQGAGKKTEIYSWEMATGNLVLDKEDLEKKRLVLKLFESWEKRYRTISWLPDPLVIQRFQKEITTRYPYFSLTNAQRTPAIHIEMTIKLLNLLPEELLRSDIVAKRLRGGFNLWDPSCGVSGQLDEYNGRLIVGVTNFTGRGYIEVFAHEFGHVLQEEPLRDPEFLALVRLAKEDPYAFPALDLTAIERRDNLAWGIDSAELFAETFMHYIFHGEQMAEGFQGLVKNPDLWKNLYAYYRDKIFYGTEYRVNQEELVAIRNTVNQKKPDADTGKREAFIRDPLLILYNADQAGALAINLIQPILLDPELLPGFLAEDVDVRKLTAGQEPASGTIFVRTAEENLPQEVAWKQKGVAVITITPQMTLAQLIQETLAQWNGRPVGEVLQIEHENSQLRIYT